MDVNVQLYTDVGDKKRELRIFFFNIYSVHLKSSTKYKISTVTIC